MSLWGAPPTSLRLGPDEVHVWRSWLDIPAEALERVATTLATDERARAAAFRFPRDAARFVAARGALRAILAGYLRRPARNVRFAIGARGKPHLAGAGDLTFNLSHAGGLALCAVAHAREVGVDVEQIRDHLADRQVADRAFSVREAAVLTAAPEGRRTAAFFDLWTRKEAYAKGLGTGLAVLPRPEVVPDPDGWTLVPLAASPGFAATLAVEGKDFRLSCWELPR